MVTTKCLKLLTGEDILADVEEDLNSFRLKQPYVLVLSPEGQLAVIPWLPLAESPEVFISKNMVVMSYVPKQDLVNHYKQRTGGIVMAGPGVLNQLPQSPPNFGR